MQAREALNDDRDLGVVEGETLGRSEVEVVVNHLAKGHQRQGLARTVEERRDSTRVMLSSGSIRRA